MPEHILTVDEYNCNLRLDVFLTRNLDDSPSRTFLKGLIDTGGVKVNQTQVKAHYKVAVGDQVTIQIPEKQDTLEGIEPEDIPLDLFYEDDILLVINKPAGMLVHPAHGRYSGTLANAVMFYSKTLSDRNSFRPGIVHRLDRETSGLILIAKDDKTHVNLARQFEKHRVKKRYVALVKGNIEFDEGVIDAPLARHPQHWDKRSVSFDESAKGAKTFYRVLKRFGAQATCVALFPKSGRTHQLRVHMAHLGHPILGDDKYGSKHSFPRLGLHAQGLGFHHPKMKQYVEFSLPVPEEFFDPLPLIQGAV